MESISRSKAVFARDLFLKAMVPHDHIELDIITEKFQEYQAQAIDINGMRAGFGEAWESMDYLRGAAAMFQMIISRMKSTNAEENVSLQDLMHSIDFAFGALGIDSDEKTYFGRVFLDSIYDSSENLMERLEFASKTLIGAMDKPSEPWKIVAMSLCYLAYITSVASFQVPTPSGTDSPITPDEVSQSDA